MYVTEVQAATDTKPNISCFRQFVAQLWLSPELNVSSNFSHLNTTIFKTYWAQMASHRELCS